MPVEKTLREALKGRSAQRKQREALKTESLRKAVEDVLDGTCDNATDAARGRGLSADAVRDAVKAERARRAGKEGQS